MKAIGIAAALPGSVPCPARIEDCHLCIPLEGPVPMKTYARFTILGRVLLIGCWIWLCGMDNGAAQLVNGPPYYPSPSSLTLSHHTTPSGDVVDVTVNLPTPCHQVETWGIPTQSDSRIVADASFYSPTRFCVQIIAPTSNSYNLGRLAPGDYEFVLAAFGQPIGTNFFVVPDVLALDPSFNAAANSSVYSVALQPDGKLLVAGAFTSLVGQPRSFLARVNADGSLDEGFNPAVSGSIEDGEVPQLLLVQPDGKTAVAGDSIQVNGRWDIGRLNTDGTFDEGFSANIGSIYALAGQADGKFVVGGEFGVRRLRADGTPDGGFNPPAMIDEVSALAVQVDGKILVGGYLEPMGAQSYEGIVRLNEDGTLDSGFSPVANGFVLTLAIQADGKILVGGRFTTLLGRPRNRIGRLNTDGTLDEGFNPDANGDVWTLSPQAGGKLLAGGDFTTLGGQPRNHVGRLNADGTIDADFGAGRGASGSVYALAVQVDGKVLVGGNFTTLAGQSHAYIGRLNPTEPATQSLNYDGRTITWLRGGASPEVWRTTFEYSTNSVTWISLGAGARIPGGWELADVSLPPNYLIRARGHVTGGINNGSGWVVETMVGTPIFVTQPASRTNYAGTTAWFSIHTAGSEPISYQWHKGGAVLLDGANIGGAQSATLTMSNVSKADEGEYSVMLINPHGRAASAVATLTVLAPPFIIQQPVNRVSAIGGTASFSVVASGDPPLAYQWRRNGSVISGATESTYAIANVSEGDIGNYDVVIRNAYGMTNSVVATLARATPPTITQPLQDQRVYAGAEARFSVGASGSTTLTYQWFFNGTNPILGQTGSILVLSNVAAAVGGQYRIVARDAVGLTAWSEATLSVMAVAAWGDNSFGQTNVPENLTNIVAVSGGDYFSLALREDGRVTLWGDDSYEQMGAISSATGIVAIAAGSFHSLLLQRGGRVSACGRDYEGQVAVPPQLTNAVAIAAGYFHSLALTANGTVAAWGDNVFGQTNVPKGLSNVVAIAAGDDYCLALKADGRLVAWGDNSFGQTNLSADLTNVLGLAGGGQHSLALLENGRVVGWGRNHRGQTNVPESLTDAVAIAAGGSHSLALRSDGRVVAWGDNGSGQTNSPVGLIRAWSIAGGSRHSLALAGAGALRIGPSPKMPTWSNEIFSLTIPTVSGRIHRLEYKNALSDRDWTILGPMPGDGRVMTLQDNRANVRQRFYRVTTW